MATLRSPSARLVLHPRFPLLVAEVVKTFGMGTRGRSLAQSRRAAEGDGLFGLALTSPVSQRPRASARSSSR